VAVIWTAAILRISLYLKEKKMKEQKTFCYCNCWHELCKDSFVEEDGEMVWFQCKNCGQWSHWFFGAPAPIKVYQGREKR
jgi:transcription elongation factor Elf1